MRASSVEGRFEAFHAERPDCPSRAGRRTRLPAAALVQGQNRRRPSRTPFRRGRYRQIAAHGGAAWNASPPSHTRGYVTSARLSIQTAPFIRSSARWSGLRGSSTMTTRKRSSISSIAAAGEEPHTPSGRCTACRYALAAERRTLSNARTRPTAAATEDVRGAPRATGGAGASPAGAHDFRGRGDVTGASAEFRHHRGCGALLHFELPPGR